MLILDSETILRLAPMSRMIDCLEQAFRRDFVAPGRQVVPVPGGTERRLFLAMPAFDSSGSGVVKCVTVFPDNPRKGLPTIQAALIVFSESGAPVALLDGTTVTRLRTGAASALASKFLSRPESRSLLVIATGALAPYMALAHCAVRPIEQVKVWGRRSEAAESAAEAIRARVPAVNVETCTSLEAGISGADIVCAATRSATPLVEGRWLRAGTFVDLVGSFTPDCRESDDEVVRRARIFVDTREGAMTEAGDILEPLSRGVISRERIEAELADLVRHRLPGRRTSEEITLFKSVGSAIEDLAAAQMIVAAAVSGARID